MSSAMQAEPYCVSCPQHVQQVDRQEKGIFKCPAGVETPPFSIIPLCKV